MKVCTYFSVTEIATGSPYVTIIMPTSLHRELALVRRSPTKKKATSSNRLFTSLHRELALVIIEGVPRQRKKSHPVTVCSLLRRSKSLIRFDFSHHTREIPMKYYHASTLQPFSARHLGLIKNHTWRVRTLTTNHVDCKCCVFGVVSTSILTLAHTLLTGGRFFLLSS